VSEYQRHSVKPAPWAFRWGIYPFFKGLSLLPFWVLHRISDLLFLLVYGAFGYRKRVVQENIALSFPEKSEEERRAIVREFYRHFCDVIVETIKGLSISADELSKRMVNVDQHIYDQFEKENRNAIVVMSHCGNWEWICLMSQLSCQQKVQCVYKTLSNTGFDWMMFKQRTRFGVNAVPMEQILRVMSSNLSTTTVTAFIGDQSPSSTKGVHWSHFLNQDTAFMMGSEKIGQKFDMSLIYLSCEKVGRSRYNARTRLLTDKPKDCQPGQITEMIAQAVEAEIRQQPSYWLWSHRRWKHKKDS